MRQPTPRTWAILEAAYRYAKAHGTTTEMVLAQVAESREPRGASATEACTERAENTGGTLVGLCAPQDASAGRSVPII